MVTATAVSAVDAWQVLDSRGRPTVACRVRCAGGATAVAAVPSGASTGRYEVLELRDGGAAWGGLGVSRAVGHVRTEIAAALAGVDASDQGAVDAALTAADGSSDLHVLGGNAVLSASLACALAAADAAGVELWETLRPPGSGPVRLPMPMVNIVSGGAHAGGLIDIQDVLVVPVGARTFGQAIEWAARVRAGTAAVMTGQGLASTLVADEGGLAGGLRSNRAALALVVDGIEASGLRPGTDVALALDLAATQFQLPDGTYRWTSEQLDLTGAELVAEVAGWCRDFPVRSVEDVAGEDDWDAWALATARLPGVQLVGDDLFATDPARLARATAAAIASSVLVKVNQAGTLSRAAEVVRTARAAGYSTVVSARSGETEDTWLADLAVGWDAGQIKVGSTMRSERTAKCNRLLALEHLLGDRATLARFPDRGSVPQNSA